jgi:hypothetical protein
MDVPTTGAVEPLRLFQFESRRKSVVCDVPIVGGFRVGRWDVADRFEGWPVVEPFDRVSRGPFGIAVMPRPLVAGAFALIQRLLPRIEHEVGPGPDEGGYQPTIRRA